MKKVKKEFITMDLFSPCILSEMQLKKYLYLKIEEVERELKLDVEDIAQRCNARRQVYVYITQYGKQLIIKKIAI
jgi:hypothetical protein